MKALIEYMGTVSKLAGGDHDGENFQAFCRGKSASLHGRVQGSRRQCLIGWSRGNGKSAFVRGDRGGCGRSEAGPLTGNRREVLCVASSFSQARIIFEDVLYFLRSAEHDLGNRRDVAVAG